VQIGSKNVRSTDFTFKQQSTPFQKLWQSNNTWQESLDIHLVSFSLTNDQLCEILQCSSLYVTIYIQANIAVHRIHASCTSNTCWSPFIWPLR